MSWQDHSVLLETHWLVMTQGLMLLLVVVPAVALLATWSTPSAGRRARARALAPPRSRDAVSTVSSRGDGQRTSERAACDLRGKAR